MSPASSAQRDASRGRRAGGRAPAPRASPRCRARARSVPSGRRGARRGVLEAHATCSRPSPTICAELVARRLDRLDLRPPARPRAGARSPRDDGRERARERADAQPSRARRRPARRAASPASASRSATASACASSSAPGRGRRRPARAAVEQLHAELALERGDLLGDRRLGQRERLAARENDPWRATSRNVSRRRGSISPQLIALESSSPGRMSSSVPAERPMTVTNDGVAGKMGRARERGRACWPFCASLRAFP